MGDDERQYRAVRDGLHAGRLPDARPRRVWGGQSAGARCAICCATIATGEAELELEFEPQDGATAAQHHVHPRCFTAWQLERDGSKSGGRMLDSGAERAALDRLRAGGRTGNIDPCEWNPSSERRAI